MTALEYLTTDLSLFALALAGPLTLGALGGVLDSVLGDDGDSEQEATDAGDALFDEDGGDEFGDLGGDDEEFGDLRDDTFEGLEDGDDDGGGGSAAELESRVDELENELAEISSTMSTVRSENEAMNETVEETEENVRKLLEIYEMVTKGVNPFVDEAGPGGEGLGGGGGGNDFGLFEDDGEDEPEEDLDEEVVEAEAESFFDDDFDEFDEEEADPFEEDDAAADLIEGEDFGADDGAGADDSSTGSIDDGGDGATTFDQLKEEYESGEADWADEDGQDGDDGANGGDTPGGSHDGGALDDVEGDTFEEDIADDGMPDATVDDAGFDDRPIDDTAEDPGTEFEWSDGVGDAAAEGSSDADDGGAYLRSLPENYAADLVVMEWVDYLVSTGGIQGALGAIRYYENVGWVGTDVADHLEEVVTRIGSDGDGGDLTIEDHRRSLQYVRYLGGDR